MIGKILGLSPDQVKVAKYAIKMRAKGFHLLKNPKGTPGTEVNLISGYDGYDYDSFHDRITDIHRIKAVFSNGKKQEKNVYINSVRYRDSETKEIGKKRNVEYCCLYSDEKTGTGAETHKNRTDISENDLKKRKKTPWQKGFLYHEYHAEYEEKERRKIWELYSFPKKDSEIKYKKPNFFKLLWDNLHNEEKGK